MSDIEQQFFKTFGIEARAKSKEVRNGLIECGLYYPEITAEKLIEIMRIVHNIKDINDLKVAILSSAIHEESRIKERVRALFGGEE